MKFMRFVAPVTAACGLTLSMAAPVLASADVSNTGSDSQQTVVIENNNSASTTNTNVVSIYTENIQKAESGDVEAIKNTNVGGLTSGEAKNQNTTDVAVVIGNEVAGGEGNVPGENGGVGSEGNQSGNGAGNGNGGNVLGASTGGAGGAGGAVLPVTGPSSPMDVSALRAALIGQMQSGAPAVTLAEQTRDLTGLALIVATVLAVVSALGTAAYTRRKEGRV